uniref:Uncharacterized protein n=1 Tax=Anguilla anguilla TaxID=7936 RepID=A0A0E9QTX4_ANGAN
MSFYSLTPLLNLGGYSEPNRGYKGIRAQEVCRVTKNFRRRFA